jgi:hypothetical protein
VLQPSLDPVSGCSSRSADHERSRQLLGTLAGTTRKTMRRCRPGCLANQSRRAGHGSPVERRRGDAVQWPRHADHPAGQAADTDGRRPHRARRMAAGAGSDRRRAARSDDRNDARCATTADRGREGRSQHAVRRAGRSRRASIDSSLAVSLNARPSV